MLSEKTQLHRRVPLEKSPVVLQERARTIVARLGYTAPFLDSTYGPGSETAAMFFVTLFGNYPMTTDFSVCYAPSTIFVLVIGAAVVAFAFYTSLGGQPVFKGRLTKGTA